MKRRSKFGMAIAAGGATVALAAAPANAAFHTYTITRSSATYQAASSNVLPLGADDQVVDVPTPFTIRLYNANFNVAHISSNGNIQFTNGTPSTAYVNTALPTSSLTGTVVAPYWDDLIIRAHSSTVVDGIFVKTKGRAPHRSWIVSWRGVDFATQGTTVRFEAIFTERSQNVVTIYGDGNGSSATIGLQRSASGPATQYAFDSGHNNTILPGEKLTYIFH
jgi:hypothetical protein